MIRKMAMAACVIVGVSCLIALADQGGLTDPLWAKVWPRVVLARRPSPAEVYASDLSGRVEAVRRRITEAKELLITAAQRRQDLLRQLRERLREADDAGDLGRLQEQNPVAFALIRSVDAEDRKQAESQQSLAELEAQLASLEARQIASQNGVNLAEAGEQMRPSDELRAETGNESMEVRFQRIIRDAKNVQ